MPKHSKIVSGKKTTTRDIGPGAPVENVGAKLRQALRRNPAAQKKFLGALDPDGTARANVAARKGGERGGK